MPATENLLRILKDRGFVHQMTDEEGLHTALKTAPLVGYIGFDCTAPSLHVGNLVAVMMLRHLQRLGHRPIVVLGGGTSRVGDPSGKDAMRQLLDTQQIEANRKSLQRIFNRFLPSRQSHNKVRILNNSRWLNRLNHIDFLRQYGRHFSIGRMLSFESIKGRLTRTQPLSLLEFSYMALQAYDFVELYRREGCRLQMGGADQWGNIVCGIDLARKVDGAELFGLTAPLLTTADGKKMGKTVSGAVWLDSALLSPYDYWQFWRNTHDGDVGRFLRLFTELGLEEIASLERAQGEALNVSKEILATHATTLAHGKTAALSAMRAAKKVFVRGESSAQLPRVFLPATELENGVGLLRLLVKAGFAKTNSEARRSVLGGGVKVNDKAITDVAYQCTLQDMRGAGQDTHSTGKSPHIKLSFGKKRHALIEYKT